MEAPLMIAPHELAPSPSTDLEGDTVLSDPENHLGDLPHHNTKKALARGKSQWMQRSALRKHFRLSQTDGLTTASCIHCGRTFYESNSTGNLSKHVKNIHPCQYRSQKAATIKERSLDSLIMKSRSLPLPGEIARECKHSPGSIGTIGFLTERLLPFSFVSSRTWKWICKACPEMSFIQSRTTINTKLETYSQWFDKALVAALEQTDFINLELDVWTGGNGHSYLGIAASFAPNLLNEKMLQGVGEKALLNNCEETNNSHLLDFVDISGSRHTGESLHTTVVEVLNRFRITNKVLSFTSDNATNNTAMHSFLLHNLIKPSRTTAFKKTKNFHHVRCASHILNLLFQEIVRKLREDERFEKGLRDVSAFAKIIKRSSLLRSAIADTRLPLVPSAPETRWIFIWKQVATFLKHHKGYLGWAQSLKSNEQYHNVLPKIEMRLQLTDETVQLLEYFTSCCSIFQLMNDTLQDNNASNIANAVTFYSTMKEFYDLCSRGETETIPASPEGFFDFTFINGKFELSEEIKSTVLKAIISSRSKFDEYFELYEKNDIYFVAAFLDPSIKGDYFKEFFGDNEGSEHFRRVEAYVKGYLKQCQSENHPYIDNMLKPVNTNRVTKFKRLKLHFKQPPERTSKALEEWENYKADSHLTSDSLTDAVKWWYSRRLTYPHLFPLALSMLYTKFSTCGIERTFSISGKLMRSDRRSLGSANARRIMLLRDRFFNFGLYDKELLLTKPGDADDFINISSDEEPLEDDCQDDDYGVDDDDAYDDDDHLDGRWAA
ncbi:putative transposase of the Rover3 hAT-like family [Lachancea sp. 'fantastica']|nr:putative transposase of the Rover3 hAT-like family [Lachancea sp. 'fantastica']